MATKRDTAAVRAVAQPFRGRKRLVLVGILLLAAFLALDQWRTAQPALTPSLLPAGATSAAISGRNTPQPRTNLGIIPGHNRLRKLAGGEVERSLEPDPLTGLPPDPGATCKDGPSEADITWNVARRVADELKRGGQLTVDLLSEFDPLRAREKFFGLALISIHVDACLKDFSGFKVAHIAQSSVPQVEDALPESLKRRWDLPPYPDALAQVHFPDDEASLEAAKRRIAFDEAIVRQLALRHGRRRRTRIGGQSHH